MTGVVVVHRHGWKVINSFYSPDCHSVCIDGALNCWLYVQATPTGFQMALKITDPPGSWGLPEWLQIHGSHSLHRESGLAELPNTVPFSKSFSLQRYTKRTYLCSLLGQLLLNFGFLHGVLRRPLLPLFLHSLPLLILSLLLHFGKLSLHTAWRTRT